MVNFSKNSDKGFSNFVWSWDEKAGICLIKVPGNGEETILSVIK
jgi:hypothetical protein